MTNSHYLNKNEIRNTCISFEHLENQQGLIQYVTLLKLRLNAAIHFEH